jgi:hypothetical protein
MASLVLTALAPRAPELHLQTPYAVLAGPLRLLLRHRAA